MAVSAIAYRDQLQALLPRGHAWPREPDAALTKVADALAQELARIDGRGETLRIESDPRRTIELLPDWERLLGLPDACSAATATFAERRAAINQKLVTSIGVDTASIIALAARYGRAITVTQIDQVRADAIPMLDTSNGRWRFVWWISVPGVASYWNTLSGVDEALATYGDTELRCRLKQIAPAHTLLIITD